MLPIPKECLHLLIRDKLDSQVQSERIRKELAFCRKNKDKIERQAKRTYERITNNVSEALTHNSCDFKLLEQAYIEYCIANKLECQQIKNQDNALKKLNEIYSDFLNNTKIDNKIHNDFATQYGELPQTLDTAENRGKISKYLIEQLNNGEISESQRESIERLRQAISDFETPLFIQETEKITEWCEAAQEKAAERLEERKNQNYER